MAGDAERIKALRQRSGKSVDDVASLTGLGIHAYCDVESYDDELRTVLSLGQVRRLAEVLGVRTSALFLDEPHEIEQRVSYSQLVALVEARFALDIDEEAFEQEIGWDLSGFFKDKERLLSDYNVKFLQKLCPRLGIEWIVALP